MRRDTLAYILVSGVLGVAGQLILKRAMLALGPLTVRPEAVPGIVVALALNPLVLLGLGVTVSGTFFWLVALSRLDLSFAYPFASLNYVLVLIAAWVILGEQPTAIRIFGVVLICAGVMAISRTPARTRLRRHPAAAVSQPAGEV